MADNQEKIDEQVLVAKSLSGPSKNIVEMRPGPSKNQVKCKIRKLLPTKISRLILPSKKDSSDNSLKSFHSSIANIHPNNNEESKCFVDQSGDFQNEEQELKNTFLSNSTASIKKDSKSVISHLDVKNEEQLSTACEQVTVNESIIEPIFVKNKQIISVKDTASIDDDIISSSVYSIDLQDSISSSATTLLRSKSEVENKDSTLHINYDNVPDDFEPDDDEEDFQLKQSKKKKRISTEHTMLASPKESLVIEDEEEHSQSENEEPESVDLEQESSTEHSRYLVSGLRRLKSEESLLHLDSIMYKEKRKPPTPEHTSEEIDPVLEELSSDLFEEARKARAKREKKAKPVEETKPTPIPPSPKPTPPSPKPEMKKEEDTSEEDEEEETEESSEIDQTPLHKLKELEDRRYKIDTKDLIPPEPEIQDVFLPGKKLGKKIPSRSKGSEVISPPEKKRKEDFCLHTKGKRDQRGKKKSRFGFLRHFDICIHTMDGDDDDIYSTSTVDYPISDKERKSSSLPRPSSVSIQQPSRSKSQGFSTVSLINNKGSRRSKLKQPSSKNWRHV